MKIVYNDVLILNNKITLLIKMVFKSKCYEISKTKEKQKYDSTFFRRVEKNYY
jgi:hypothetical protein